MSEEIAPTLISAKAEKKQAYKEYSKQIEVLRAKWPKAFPSIARDVVPLVTGCNPTIAAEFGWTLRYTRAILQSWRIKEAYCRAVLRHSRRINLDGTPSDDVVSDEAKKLAKDMLAQIEARKAAKRERLRTLELACIVEAQASPPVETPAPPVVVSEPEKPKKFAASAAMLAALARKRGVGSRAP